MRISLMLIIVLYIVITIATDPIPTVTACNRVFRVRFIHYHSYRFRPAVVGYNTLQY
jgi:hypothetical protein